MVYTTLLVVSCLLLVTNPCSGAKICDAEDVSCTTRVAANHHSLFIKSILNAVDSSDLLLHDYIKGYLPALKYHYYNATLSGIKTCTVKKLQIDRESQTLRYSLECPVIDFNALYNLKGNIGNYSVKGEGVVNVNCDVYTLEFDCDYEKYLGTDYKQHVRITNYILNPNPTGKVQVRFSNLIAYDEQKTHELHKFIDENWQFMDKELRAPVLNDFMDIFIEKLNKYLEKISVEELLTDST